MELYITAEAENQIKKRMNEDHNIVKLKYETEDCGCVVCGVPTIELTNKQNIGAADYKKVTTNAMDVYFENSKLIFFNDEMKIDFLPEKHCFQLSSPSEILNPRMSCKVT